MLSATRVKHLLKNIKRNEEVMSILFGVLALVAGGTLLANNMKKFQNRLRQPLQIPQTQQIRTFQSLPESVNLENLPAEYTVQQGDSSWEISKAFFGTGFLYTKIEQENELTTNQELEPGMLLKIPLLTQEEIEVNIASESSTQKSNGHVTTATDTLWKLAQQY